jgi:Protein of unknown function (DUF1416)
VSCGPAAAAAKAVGVDLASQAVIQGSVVREDKPVKGAYVRLLDTSGEFTAEVPTGESGEFRFFAAPGEWTVRVLTPQADPLESRVTAARGAVAELELTL